MACFAMSKSFANRSGFSTERAGTAQAASPSAFERESAEFRYIRPMTIHRGTLASSASRLMAMKA